MGKRLERRLKSLEERRGVSPKGSLPRRGEEEHKRRWLENARIRGDNIVRTKHVAEVRRAIGRLHTTGALYPTKRPSAKLIELTYEEAVEEVLELTRPKDWMIDEEGPSRGLVEREVALAIYRQQEGTERMACPPEWRESFVVGDELRERYMNIPDEELAKEVAWLKSRSDEELGEIAAGKAKISHQSQFFREAAGITDELQRKALGPDHERITKEEQVRRITEYLRDAWFGEKGYRVRTLFKALG